jgi:putative sigma-54 modulation protein
MKAIINARQINIDDDLKNHIEKKLSKFNKFFPDDAEACVTLSRIKSIERVEVMISSKGVLVRAEEESSTFKNALDNCIEKIDGQIRRNKTKLSKRVREGLIFPEDEVYDEGEADTAVIRTKSFRLKPMDVEEAILQMELLNHSFFVFYDIETDETCVVYKRRGGSYGLIRPEK